MGITIVRDGVIVDKPVEECDSGPAGDGRQYLPYAAKTYHQDNTTDVVTGRAFNASIELPPSGSYTRVLGAPKQTEAEDSQITSVRQAKTVTDTSLQMVQDARDQEYQRLVNQQAQRDAEIKAATTLTPLGQYQYGSVNGAWQLKRNQS